MSNSLEASVSGPTVSPVFLVMLHPSRWCGSEREACPSRHDVHAAVDVHGFAADSSSVGRGEVGAREADIHDVHELTERGALGRLGQHEIEVLETASGARLQRAG